MIDLLEITLVALACPFLLPLIDKQEEDEKESEGGTR